jgi:PAS domain S-box-containing protein
MRLGLTINKGLFAGILLALLIFCGMLWYSYRETGKANKTAALIAHYEEILYQTTQILATITDNETGARGFVITGKPEFLEPLEKSKKRIYQQIATLQGLVKDNHAMLISIDSLLFYVNKRVAFSDTMVALRSTQGVVAASNLVSRGQGKFYHDKIRGLINHLQTGKNDSLEREKLAIAVQLKAERITFFALAFIMLGLMIIVFVKERVRVQQKERDRAQLALASLTLHINESNNAIYTLDVQRKIVSWNRGAQHLYGYSEKEAMGKDSNQMLNTKILPGELNSAIIELVRDDYWTGELERMTKTGKVVFVNSSITTIKNDKGFVTGYVAIGIDITAQKKLTRQVSYLASLVEQSSEAIFSRDTSQQLTSWNYGAEKLFGYTKNEAIGKTISQLGILKLTQQEIEDAQADITGTGSWESEKIYNRKDGSSFVGAVTGNVIKNEKAEDTSYYFIVKDITVRKQLQERLKQHNQELEEKVIVRTEEISKNEQRFRALVENNYDIITLIDESFNIIYQSPSVSRVTGFSFDEIQALDGGENIHPDDREHAQQVFQQATAKPGEPISATFRTRHKQGHYLQMEGVITNLLPDNNVKAFVTNFRDVTGQLKAKAELETSEKRFRALIEKNKDVIMLLDESFKVTYRSPSATEVNGWTDEDVKTMSGIGQIHPDDMPDAHTIIAEMLDNPGKPLFVTFRNRHKNGDYRWLEGVITNLLHDKHVNAILFNFRDVTGRVEAGEKIKNLNIELEEKICIRTQQLRKSNEELEAFSYSVSHDLRAPLRAIAGYSSILEEDYGSKLDNEARRITGIIKKNTLKMGNLIDDLLAFSRTGKHELVKSLLNTEEMVNGIIAEMDHTTGTEQISGITWKINALPFVLADASAMRQVWVNLISNAVKYSCKTKDPVIEIGSFIQGNQTAFFVRDNGAGFDEKYKDKLFKVFQRLHGSKEFEGTGIGLAIVDKIISKHGGTVWAAGAVNEGACFYFSLPAMS